MHLQILYPNTVYDTVNIYHSAISTDLFYVHATVVLGHFPIGSSSPLKTAVCGRDLIMYFVPGHQDLVQIFLLILSSFKPHVGWKNKTSKYLETILVGTQYDHIPSIRNRDATVAARATDELCIRAAQPTLPLCGSMLVCPLTCVELAHSKRGANTPTERQHKC